MRTSSCIDFELDRSILVKDVVAVLGGLARVGVVILVFGHRRLTNNFSPVHCREGARASEVIKRLGRDGRRWRWS